MDALNIYWEPGIRNLQDSRNIFVVTLMDTDLLEQQYPFLKGSLQGNKVIDVKQYIYDDTIDTANKCLVVDWYYQNIDGKPILHLTKSLLMRLYWKAQKMIRSVVANWIT